MCLNAEVAALRNAEGLDAGETAVGAYADVNKPAVS